MADELDDKVDDPAPTPATKTKPVEPTAEELSPEEVAAELAKARKALKAANAEAQKNREARKKLEELEEADRKRQEDALSEEEKRKARLAATEQKARDAEERAAKLERENWQLKIDREVEAEAQRQGIADPRLVAPLLRGLGGNGIEIDPDSGKTLGVKAAVDKLLKDYPDLQTSGVARGRGTPSRMDSPYKMAPRSAGAPRTDNERAAELAEADTAALRGRIRYDHLW